VRVGTFLERETLVEQAAEEDRPGRGLLRGYPRPDTQRTARTDTRVVEAGFARIVAACDVPGLGMRHIPLREMRTERGAIVLEPFELVRLQSRAVVFAPSRPADRALTPASGKHDGQMRVVEQQLKILFYPVWHGRFAHGGRMYSMAVDGVRGAVLDGHAPLDRGQAAWLLAAALGTGALAWSRLLHGLVVVSRSPVPDGGPGLLAALAGAAALVVAAGAFRMFRRGGELHWAAEEGVWVSGRAGESRSAVGMLLAALFAGIRGGARE
jgi:hypothetical protein